MSSTYFPIKNHGGIPNMLSADGSITTKKLVTDTRVGKKHIEALPHLIANTVDNLAKGIPYAVETNGEPSLIKPGKARRLVTDTKKKISMYEELTAEEMATRNLHKRVGMRFR
jgi:hypothetical protein